MVNVIHLAKGSDHLFVSLPLQDICAPARLMTTSSRVGRSVNTFVSLVSLVSPNAYFLHGNLNRNTGPFRAQVPCVGPKVNVEHRPGPHQGTA